MTTFYVGNGAPGDDITELMQDDGWDASPHHDADVAVVRTSDAAKLRRWCDDNGACAWRSAEAFLDEEEPLF